VAEASAERVDVVEVIGPHAVADAYRWLEDPADPRTVRWLAAQQQLFEAERASWDRRGWFRRRLTELSSYDECSLPVWRGPTAFYTCRGPADEHAALRAWQPAAPGGPADSERVVCDPAGLDPTGGTTLDAWEPSTDGSLVACQLSVGGTEESALHVIGTRSGELVEPPIGGCRFASVAWLPDRHAFYYVREPPDGGGLRVWLHEVGQPAARDAEVFGAAMADATDLDVALDRRGGRLLVTVVTDLSATTDVWVVTGPGLPEPWTAFPVAACPGAWKVAWPGDDGQLYLVTDHDAPRGRLVAVDASLAATDAGRTLIAPDDEATLEDFAILDGAELAEPVLLVAWSHPAGSYLTRHDLRTGERRGEVTLPGTGVISGLAGGGSGHEAWLSYGDPLTPTAIFRYDAVTGELAPWRAATAAATPTGVVATESEYSSPDGTRVRLLLTRPAGAQGPLPTILQGYGAFGLPQVADYYEVALAWAQAGGMFAIACVRGGGEEGEDWHRAGMGPNKQRGIDDLLAAARHLVAAGLAAPGHLGVKGVSAGGLLAAAAFVQGPELFAAAECTSPLLDMARYELTGLGRHWTGEFGSRDDPEQLGCMLAYSPYHNVTAGTAYPAVLFATFDGDTRVDPMHARKMCAQLQYASASGRPVLLRAEAGVGHGERSRSAALDYFADVLAFFAHALGLQ
jgi:prolyl oligopeptidase